MSRNVINVAVLATIPLKESRMQMRRCAKRAGLTLVALMILACGNEVIVYDAIRLEIQSESPDGGPITRYDIAVLGVDDGGGVVQKLPSTAGEEAKKFAGPLPAGVDLVNKAFLVDVDISAVGNAAQIKRLQL